MKKDGEEIIYSQPLSGGRSILVIRGTNLAASDLVDVFSVPAIGESLWAYTVRIELRGPRPEPIVLWSWLKRDPGSRPGFDVLDLRVEPDRIIMLCGEFGGISVSKIDVSEGTAIFADLDTYAWNGVGAASSYNRRNTLARLVPSTDHSKLTVELTTLGKKAGITARFEQVGNDWKFNHIGRAYLETEDRQGPTTEPAGTR